jgi:cytosine/adenosine deaminase-related metal-dependent hydrolase
MSKPLTPGQVRALETILRYGGKVGITMGRLGGPWVRTRVVMALRKLGFVREWTGKDITHGCGRIGQVDIAVTAAGCQALNEAHAQRELRSQK